MPPPSNTPQPQAAPQISDDVLGKFMALPNDKKRDALGRMSVDTKQALLMHIKQRGTATAAPAATAPQATTAPSGATTGQKVDLGLQQGVLNGFGLQPKDPNRPQDITTSEVAKQSWDNLRNAAKQSYQEWKKYPEIVPFDMLGHGIDSMATTLERGARDSYAGYKSDDPRLMGQGGGEILASIGQIFGGAEAPEAVGKVARGTLSAAQVAKQLPLVVRRAKLADFENDFVHAKGIDVAKQVKRAANAVDAEIKTHTDALQQAIPKDAINAAQELQDAQGAIDAVVKTPDAYPGPIKQMAVFIKSHPGGAWDFDTAKQFRSALGAAMKQANGPMEAGLTKAYVDLTAKMEAAAKAVGGEKSWQHYNELTKKFYQQSGELIGSVLDANNGLDVSKALLKNPALTKETINNLGKYGLDTKDAAKFADQSNRILQSKRGFGRSLMRMIYTDPTAFLSFGGAHALGASYWQAIPIGLGVGVTKLVIRNARDVADMDPKIVDQYRKARAFPDKMPPTAAPPMGTPTNPNMPTPAPPPSASPASAPAATAPAAAPAATAPISPAAASALDKIKAAAAAQQKSKLKPLTKAEKIAQRETVRGQVDPSGTPTAKTPPPSAPEAKASTTAGKEAVGETTSPEVTKVPEGQHGTGTLADRAAAAERKAKQRAKDAATSGGASPDTVIGTTTAEGATPSIEEIGKKLGASDTPTIEIEDFLKEEPSGKVALSAFKKYAKSQKWTDDEYRGYLLDWATKHFEAKMQKAAEAAKPKDEF